jgi:uncharacterized RDD family membrane protein YckC
MRRDCAASLASRCLPVRKLQAQANPRRYFAMRCPSCGAIDGKGSEKCAECGADTMNEAPTPEAKSQSFEPAKAEKVTKPKAGKKKRAKRASSLIEFPGVSRSSVPQWRKELGERVREVQERRAREAEEAARAEQEREEEAAKSPPPLELLPQVEVAPINPLVAAALRRIERAHTTSDSKRKDNSTKRAVSTTVRHDRDRRTLSDGRRGAESMTAAAPAPEPDYPPLEDKRVEPEKTHNLIVVPSPAGAAPKIPEVEAKPKRLIADDPNDPALNYLNAILNTERAEEAANIRPPAIRRVLSAVVDLVIVAFLWSPFAATVELMGGDWQTLEVLGLAVGALIFVSFLYLTICTALTGQTLGMRLLSLRVVDARTGLIPTGKQSAGRALLCIASFLSAGIGLIYAFFDSESRTAHDRFSQTAVIRA